MSLAEIHKKAKLVMIPSGFKADEILYSVLPNDGSGNFTASGDTDSTRVNKDGLIEKVTTLVPRLNYDFGNPKNPHLLLESQSTNLVTHSENFDSYFTKFNSNNTPNVDTSPLGSLTANKFFTDSNNSAHTLFKIETVSTNPFTFSIFAKKLQKNFIQIILGSDFGNTHSNINLENGVVTAESGHTTTVQNYGNGWYRISATATPSGTSGYFSVGIIDASDSARNASSQGDGVSGILIWGAQIEQSSFATSYIPTSSSTVTRSQDTCTGGGSSSIFNDSEGTLFLDISRPINDSTTRSISISDGGSSDRVIIQYISGFILGIVASETTTVATLLFSTTSTSLNKIALRYKKNDFAMYVNGTQAGTDTSGNAPVGLSSFDFNDGTGSQKYEGQCTQAMYFDTALTNAELTTLTT